MAVNLIEDNSLQVLPEGFEIRIRLHWYRSLPLSCVEKVSLSLDGEPVDPGDIWFGINDHLYQLKELDELTGEYWFVQDSARLVVKQTGKVAPGETHTIEAELIMRAPYILVGPEKFMTMPAKLAVVQTAA